MPDPVIPSPNPTPSPAPAVDPAAAYLDYLASLGYDVRQQGITDARTLTALLNELAETRQQYQQAQPLLQQFVSQKDQFAQWQAQQQQAQTPQPKAGWSAPEFDPTWMGRVEYNPANGQWVPRDQMDWSVAQKVNNYHQWQQNVQRDFARDPLGLLKNAGLESYVQEAVKKLVEDQVNPLKSDFEKQLARTRQEATIAQYQQLLYSLDANGNTVETPFGQKVQTQYQQAIAHAKMMGYEPDETKQQELLGRIINEERQRSVSQAQQQAAPPSVPDPASQPVAPQVPTPPNGSHQQPVNRVQDVLRRASTVNQQVPVTTHTPSTPQGESPDPRSGAELRQQMMDKAKAEGIPL